jgi:IS5 family transposase
MPVNPYGDHTLYETLEQDAILTDIQAKEVVTDLGYRGATVQEGIKVFHPWLKRKITPRLRRAIRRRSAIEPAIEHMKNEGRLGKNWSNGVEGDACHALPCGCGHNLRMTLRKL